MPVVVAVVVVAGVAGVVIVVVLDAVSVGLPPAETAAAAAGDVVFE